MAGLGSACRVAGLRAIILRRREGGGMGVLVGLVAFWMDFFLRLEFGGAWEGACVG